MPLFKYVQLLDIWDFLIGLAEKSNWLFFFAFYVSFGHVFLVDTGTSNGTIGGPSKPINSCDFRPARPFRIIAGSEDNSVTIFEGICSLATFFSATQCCKTTELTGPPFKWKMTKTEHTRYVQSVRYSPNGDHFATGGFDGKVFIYDGKTSDLIGELGKIMSKLSNFLVD